MTNVHAPSLGIATIQEAFLSYIACHRLPLALLPLMSASPILPVEMKILSTRWWLAHHLCLLLLESLTNSLTPCHELLYASGYAAGLALDKGFCGEVIDAGVEAVGYKIGEHLWVENRGQYRLEAESVIVMIVGVGA